MKPWLAFKTGPGFDGSSRWFGSQATNEVVIAGSRPPSTSSAGTRSMSVTPNGKAEAEPARLSSRRRSERNGSGYRTVFLPIHTAQKPSAARVTS